MVIIYQDVCLTTCIPQPQIIYKLVTPLFLLQCGRPEFNPWIGKIPWRRESLTHSSILAWRIPLAEEPGGLQPVGSQRVGDDLVTGVRVRFHPAPTGGWAKLVSRVHVRSAPAALGFDDLLSVHTGSWTIFSLANYRASSFSDCSWGSQGKSTEVVCIPSSSGPCLVRNLHREASVLGGPAWRCS